MGIWEWGSGNDGLGMRMVVMHVVMCVSPQSHSQIQQEYQTFYHKSFRVSDYLARADAKLRDLLEACEGIKVGADPLPDPCLTFVTLCCY